MLSSPSFSLLSECLFSLSLPFSIECPGVSCNSISLLVTTTTQPLLTMGSCQVFYSIKLYLHAYMNLYTGFCSISKHCV